ncbi:hippocampus abundant transcript-like protein 1 [Quillaja saponaria]|uniref:Hippocampus abundant transcript-like protein 1 n=1 Tax=Quillaja saponaria TaxID=32244 RepID=A0AAD7LZG5_QUISA|nr:hippocampus abundant transcript-like protein 1 [Quillaja saponaria]
MQMESLTGLGHLYVTFFLSSLAGVIVIPAMTDITMAALCPGQDQCSLAIYLSGFQQAITGLGAVVITPLIGNLSDHYGRKALLTLPMTISIIPLAILAYSRSTNFFYAYYVVKTLSAMLGEGCTNCLALAYVADNIPEGKRASAFGILGGVVSAAFVCGTLAARFLSTDLTFQVAAFLSVIAAAYMRIYLKESIPPGSEGMRQPILKAGPLPSVEESDQNESRMDNTDIQATAFGGGPDFLAQVPTFSQAAVVLFFNSLADGGLQASLLYFLKARFHFSKNQFADLMLMAGVSGALSQLLFMPTLVPALGEEKLLSAGLLVGCINMLVYSISWAPWLCSIASKQVGPSEQGMVQGCLSGISSFANIISPLIFSPLTALFLSEEAPFYFPGFSIMCLGIALMMAFVQSLMIRAIPSTASFTTIDQTCEEA